MKKPVVYIDGKEGTTGLQIYDRLAAREDIELLLIDEDKRKDPTERARLMDRADIVFLCLPDAAAREAVTLVSNPDTRIIDASTAHRVHPDWASPSCRMPTVRRSAPPVVWPIPAAMQPALSALFIPLCRWGFSLRTIPSAHFLLPDIPAAVKR